MLKPAINYLSAMNLQHIFELLGTYAFAISGALAVKDKEHDWFGAGFTGFLTAIGEVPYGMFYWVVIRLFG